jgi:hypothetical protein
MSQILQLDPIIYVTTPLGEGRAIFIIDYGINLNTWWVVALDGVKDEDIGAIKHFDSEDIRLHGNPAHGIKHPVSFKSAFSD